VVGGEPSACTTALSGLREQPFGGAFLGGFPITGEALGADLFGQKTVSIRNGGKEVTHLFYCSVKRNGTPGLQDGTYERQNSELW